VVVTAGPPKAGVVEADGAAPPPILPKLNIPEVEVVVEVAACVSEDELVPNPKTFCEAVVVVVFCPEFPKANKLALAEAVVVAAVVFPPKLNILGGELGSAAALAEVVVAPPVKLKAGARAELEVPTALLLETDNWKLGGALVATAVAVPKEKVFDDDDDDEEEEEVVEEETEVGAGPKESVLVGGTMAVAVVSGLETPKLNAGTTGAEDDVETWIGWTLEAVEVEVTEDDESEGRLNVTVAVLTEIAGFVGSAEEEGEEIAPKEKGEGVVDVTDVNEAVGTDVAVVLLSLLVLLVAGVEVSVDDMEGSPVAALS